MLIMSMSSAMVTANGLGQTLLVVILLCYGPLPVLAFEPGFISPLENITVAAGRAAQFTCVVKHLGGHKVAWLRSDSKAILAIHTHMVTNNPRMTVEHNGHNSWTLRVDNVERNDSGIYMCQINTEPMTSQIGYLNVVESPDILYNETSNDTTVLENFSTRLRCEAKGFPAPTVMWRREDGKEIAVRRKGKATERVEAVEGNQLELRHVARSDMGAYLCIASNGIPSPVSKRIMVQVHFGPLIKVQEQIVTVRLGNTVELSCTIEASPKSINYWVKQGATPRDRVMPIFEGEDFMMRQMDSTTPYETIMTLTISKVRAEDLGNYTCAARNTRGAVRGTISLKKLYVPPPPPTEKKVANRVVEISEVDSEAVAKEVERRRQEKKRRKSRDRDEKKGDGEENGFTYSEGSSSENNLKNARRQEEESSQRKSMYGVSEAHTGGASPATIICLFAATAQLLLR